MRFFLLPPGRDLVDFLDAMEAFTALGAYLILDLAFVLMLLLLDIGWVDPPLFERDKILWWIFASLFWEAERTADFLLLGPLFLEDEWRLTGLSFDLDALRVPILLMTTFLADTDRL